MAQTKTKSGGFSLPAWLVIIVALVVSELVFHFVFGDVKHFVDEARKEPKPGDYFGIIYKGGFIVPFLMTMFIVLVTFSIERFLMISKAKGTGNLEDFLKKIKSQLEGNNLSGAIDDCNKQKGSVANVVQAGLNKYKEMQANNELTTEQKVLNISKELEEATSLEMPMLEKNLTIIATIASVGTLIALLGTVLGMIRAFAALATSGTPDPTALASGISEALINTALGISTSAIAIIMYSYFTSKIDGLTYAIDEMGFSLSQTFAAKNK